MKIWELGSNANYYDNLTFLTKDGAEDYLERFLEYEFDGRSLVAQWNPLPVRLLEKIEKSDTPSLSGSVPVLNRKAINILYDLLEGSVELLPLISDIDEYYVLNVTKVIEAINHEKSEIKRFASSGRIMRFVKYSFIAEKLKETHIFKITDMPKAHVFVSDQFKDRALNNGLKGFEFTEVWESED